MKFLTIFLYVFLPLVTVIHEVYGDIKSEKVALQGYFATVVPKKFPSAAKSLEEFKQKESKLSAVAFAASLLLLVDSNEANINSSLTILQATRRLLYLINTCGSTELWYAQDDKGNTTCDYIKTLLNRTGTTETACNDIFKNQCNIISNGK